MSGRYDRDVPEQEFAIRHDASKTRLILAFASTLGFLLSVAVVSFAPGTVRADPVVGAWDEFFKPVGGYSRSVIYDPVRHRMVVYGGIIAQASFTGVHALSLSDIPTWLPVVTVGEPALGRYGHSAVYDSRRDRMIVFGGFGEGIEVWLLSLSGTPTWSRLDPVGLSPDERYFHTAIYDSLYDRMIVYGGTHEVSGILGDTWALSFADTPGWSQIAPAGPAPPPRSGHQAVLDPTRERMVVFAGNGVGALLGDMWVLALDEVPSWSSITVNGTPPTRADHSMIYDAAADRLVSYGGFGADPADAMPHYSGAVWALPLGDLQWSALQTQVPGQYYDPPFRPYRASAIYDPVGNRLIFFGFVTFELDLSSLVWKRLVVPPVARHGHSLFYDSGHDRLIVFGGMYSPRLQGVAAFLYDTWTLDLAGSPSWSPVEDPGFSPAPRAGHASVADPFRNRMLVLGGYDELQVPMDNTVWELTLADIPNWSAVLKTSGESPPPTRIPPGAVLDPRLDRMVVMNTSVDGHLDTWQLPMQNLIWSALATSGEAPITRDYACVLDPLRNRVIVCGGVHPSDRIYTNRVWELSLSDLRWTELFPAGDPPIARSHHSAIYDPVRDRVVVFGGYSNNDDDDLDLSDAWELNLGETLRWTRLTSETPTRRNDHRAVYDPSRDRMLLFGGIEDQVPLDETWGLVWGSPVRPEAQCPDDVIATAGSAVTLSYVVSHVLTGSRAVEWQLSSERDWPGFPKHGLTIVASGTADTLRIPVGVPDTTDGGGNGLRFTSWLSGGKGFDRTCEHTIGDDTTPTQVAWVNFTAEPDRVTLRWAVTAWGTDLVHVERRSVGGEWRTLGFAISEGRGLVRYEDLDVEAGRTYAYRPVATAGGSVRYGGEVQVIVPQAYGLSIEAPYPNPAPGEARVAFTLPDNRPAALDVFDLAGRRVLGRKLAGLSPGRHELTLGRAPRLSVGVYVLRLVHPAGQATARLAVVR